jgi:hypothetical protein
MSRRLKLTGWLMAGALCLPIALSADTQNTHRVHKKKETPPPPPLPSGTQGPVPQVPLESLPAVAPQVTYQDGLLTIVAPNSTLGDILRSVRKHTSADIEVPPTASERVVTRLGPAPAREVMAELLNGSRFNYILLGSSEDANTLTRVVLVAKTSADTANAAPGQADNAQPGSAPAAPVAEAQEPEPTPDDTPDDNNAVDQNSAETEQPASNPEQPGVKTPQQLLQEMQQRQLQMQQGGQPGAYVPAPGMPVPHQPQAPQQNQDQ